VKFLSVSAGAWDETPLLEALSRVLQGATWRLTFLGAPVLLLVVWLVSRRR
jgi:hypothetical protein